MESNRRRRSEPHRLFLWIAIPFGLILALVTPPFQVPDEPFHFYRAYQVSQLQMMSTVRGDEIGGDLPSNVIETVDRAAVNIESYPSPPLHSKIKFQPNAKFDLRIIRDLLRSPPTDRTPTFVSFVPTARYSPLVYLPQAVGIGLGRALHAPPLALLYFGRFSSVIAWCLCIRVCLRWLPCFRWTFFLLALLPMAMYLAASVSADTVTIAVSFLFIAMTLRIATERDRRLDRRRLIGLGALAIALGLCKPSVIPLAAIVLILPVSAFASRRSRAKTVVLVGMLCLLAGLVWFSTTTALSAHEKSGDVSAIRQATYVLHRPLTFLRINIGTLSITYLTSAIGKFGWFETRLPRWLSLGTYLVLIVISLIDGKDDRILPLESKLILAATAFVAWLAGNTLVYLTFTNVGTHGIVGLQGRYLLPITPILFLLLYNRKFIARRAAGVRTSVVVWAGFLCAMSLYIIVHRFYLP